jgi:DNA-binding NarL/FixJ family response regulator
VIRVLVVDDHPLVRQGLTGVLAGVSDIEVVDSVADGAGAADAAEAGRADVVLMDLSMPVMDGIEATREVLARCPATRVVVLTSFAEQSRVLAALEAGAVGYLLKDTEPDDLVQAVREAAAGHAPISPRAALALLPSREAPRVSSGANLSPREREVLALVAVGLPNKTIARRLRISEKTVKAHLTRIFSTLGVFDRTSAALWAQRNGLLDETS